MVRFGVRTRSSRSPRAEAAEESASPGLAGQASKLGEGQIKKPFEIPLNEALPNHCESWSFPGLPEPLGMEGIEKNRSSRAAGSYNRCGPGSQTGNPGEGENCD